MTDAATDDAAAPADAPAVSLVAAFEMGFDLANSLRGQALEDSRAVGRLLGRTSFLPIEDLIRAELRRRGFDSFGDADHGIHQAKVVLHAALAASPTRPADPDEMAR